MFEQIVNQKYFNNANILLLLNKFDLFQEKIEDKGFSLEKNKLKLFQDFDESNTHDVSAVKTYLISKFQSVFPKNKKLFISTSCAIDSSNMKLVMQACIDSIVRENMENVYGGK